MSGAQYKMFGGTAWVRNVLLTATLFCGPLLVAFSFLNTVAIVYRSTAGLTAPALLHPALHRHSIPYSAPAVRS